MWRKRLWTLLRKSVTGFFGLRSVLVGEDPFEVERLWHKMYMGTVYYGRRGAVMQVISGIDIALWDIVGKAIRQPIYKLLGAGYREGSLPMRARCSAPRRKEWWKRATGTSSRDSRR